LHRHSLTKVLPYAPDQLFQLVGDIDAYPQFVPWLTSMRVWNLRETAPGVTSLDAEASVGFSFLRERFATRVTRDADGRHISVGLLHGPFRALRNDWRFRPDPGVTRVEFSIDFAFKSRILDALLHANMDRAVGKLIGCFEARAAAIYPRTEGDGSDVESPHVRSSPAEAGDPDLSS
jgi:coenzyme Q-binding protein COQ10